MFLLTTYRSGSLLQLEIKEQHGIICIYLPGIILCCSFFHIRSPVFSYKGYSKIFDFILFYDIFYNYILVFFCISFVDAGYSYFIAFSLKLVAVVFSILVVHAFSIVMVMDILAVFSRVVIKVHLFDFILAYILHYRIFWYD